MRVTKNPCEKVERERVKSDVQKLKQGRWEQYFETPKVKYMSYKMGRKYDVSIFVETTMVCHNHLRFSMTQPFVVLYATSCFPNYNNSKLQPLQWKYTIIYSFHDQFISKENKSTTNYTRYTILLLY